MRQRLEFLSGPCGGIDGGQQGFTECVERTRHVGLGSDECADAVAIPGRHHGDVREATSREARLDEAGESHGNFGPSFVGNAGCDDGEGERSSGVAVAFHEGERRVIFDDARRWMGRRTRGSCATAGHEEKQRTEHRPHGGRL